jgi:hypothetical protein
MKKRQVLMIGGAAVIGLVLLLLMYHLRGFNRGSLAGFDLTSDKTGWTGKFPGGQYTVFGKEICLHVDTREAMNAPGTPPPISTKQAALVSSLVPTLPSLLKKVEEVMIGYDKDEPGFREFVRNPHVWLNSDDDDGVSWTFVIERTDNPGFGYHLEFKGTKFVEIWAGD